LNKSVQTGNFYTQTLVTYDTSEDAKLITKLLPLDSCVLALRSASPLWYPSECQHSAGQASISSSRASK